jgi:hypothetical protein
MKNKRNLMEKFYVIEDDTGTIHISKTYDMSSGNLLHFCVDNECEAERCAHQLKMLIKKQN